MENKDDRKPTTVRLEPEMKRRVLTVLAQRGTTIQEFMYGAFERLLKEDVSASKEMAACPECGTHYPIGEDGIVQGLRTGGDWVLMRIPKSAAALIQSIIDILVYGREDLRELVTAAATSAHCSLEIDRITGGEAKS